MIFLPEKLQAMLCTNYYVKAMCFFQDQVNGYYCSCVHGYGGNSCETNINECRSDLCHNGGTCVVRYHENVQQIKKLQERIVAIKFIKNLTYQFQRAVYNDHVLSYI